MYTRTMNAEQVTVKPLLIDIEGGEVFSGNHQLNEIFNCIKFWNNKGLECHINNNDHYATGGSYEDFILRCIASDCRAFVEAKTDLYGNPITPDQYITGKGGNHVWVSRASDNERIMFIHF